jgi:hypothetical protein
MVLAVYGLVVIRRRARVSPRAAAATAVAGVVTACLIRLICDVRVPLAPGQSDAVLYRPYIAVLVAVAVAVLLLIVTVRRRIKVAAFTIFFASALGLPAAWATHALSLVDHDSRPDSRPDSGPAAGRGTTAGGASAARPVPAAPAPPGALTVARWLREHSRPDDLVATNAHCRWGLEDPCDSRHSWVAALAERRVLVEGWTYTTLNLNSWRPGLLVQNIPFWDEERIRLNDAAFDTPSRETIGLLRRRYGVGWLFVDERLVRSTSTIGEFADLQARSGDYALYRVPGRFSSPRAQS